MKSVVFSPKLAEIRCESARDKLLIGLEAARDEIGGEKIDPDGLPYRVRYGDGVLRQIGRPVGTGAVDVEAKSKNQCATDSMASRFRQYSAEFAIV